jgi:GT2 family glycosyltransferase
MYRFPQAEDAILALIRGDPQKRYERWIAIYDTLDDSDILLMREELSTLRNPPVFSLIVPLARGSETMPDALDRSLRAQVYQRWESETVRASAVGEWNAALRSATGDYALVVDSNVMLRPHALSLFALTIASDSDALLLYGDEDEIEATGRRSRHYFKPDWNAVLLRCQNYLGGVVCFRRADALAAGGFEERADDCVWDLARRLTATAAPQRVHHIPFIVSHRVRHHRVQDGGRWKGGMRAVEGRLRRKGEHIEAKRVGGTSYRMRHSLPDNPPVVSVIVPTTCRLDVLQPCVDGLLNRTSYSQFEILLVINGTGRLAPEQRRYIEATAKQPQVRVVFHDERPYNFAKTNNWASGQAQGELLCFLNDDTEVIGSDWLSALVSEVVQEGVGAAGALLVYPNNRIQHAGVILGVGGVAAHAYRGRPRHTRGYHDRALVAQDVSCVTAACMVVRREALSDVGGFDPTLAIAFNDVDLCLRLREADWRVVWTPAAELYHKESASIGRHNVGRMEEQWARDYALIRSRWTTQLLADPHYSPSLSLDRLQFWEPAFPPRVTYPWRGPSREAEGDAPAPSPSPALT